MKNIFYGTISLTSILVALIASYYFFIFLPKSQAGEVIAENKKECSQEAAQMVSKYLTEDSVTHNRKDISSTNYFNTTLNKCFVKIQESDPCQTYCLGSSCSSSCGADISIWDAEENREIADVLGQWGVPPNSSQPDFTDYRNNYVGVEITAKDFDGLLNYYMNVPPLGPICVSASPDSFSGNYTYVNCY